MTPVEPRTPWTYLKPALALALTIPVIVCPLFWF